MTKDQIQKLAEEIYKEWWKYNGCSTKDEMIPWLEKVIEKSIANASEIGT